MKQIKNAFEFTFICGEMEECIAQSVGKPKLKVLTASCLSFKHYRYLYSKQFLRWITTSKPPAEPVLSGKENGRATLHRFQYNFGGMDKLSIIDADHIQLPVAWDVIEGSGDGSDTIRHGHGKLADDAMLTPADRTILHFMDTEF